MGAELKHDALIVGDLEAGQLRAAAVHVADRIAAVALLLASARDDHRKKTASKEPQP